ncbi:uncharacterized protein CCDC198 isoform X1 [Strigops habroptila]|uniref:uncharacterized protein CCDC198 isoform X1 n=1 Tax=Strigops habroptila TaxID=2489341 RepID=UPI0011CEEEF5|nr:uncharacterized protein CCDC198 isoform X1 [Strigops habroptila]
MGLSSSKAHPKVTKVAPMYAGEDLPILTTPYWHPSMLGQPSLHPLAAVKWGNPTIHKELPPLRETWYGQASAGPLSFNAVPEKGETSIIKQHPPRRPQRLEPACPLQAIAPAKPWSQQEVAASPKPKALEKKGQSLRHLPGRRQHLHKLQMLDLTRRRQEAELKRNLHREANINKQKIKEFSPKKVLDSLQRGNSTESQDLVPAEHNQRFHGDDRGRTEGGYPHTFWGVDPCNQSSLAEQPWTHWKAGSGLTRRKKWRMNCLRNSCQKFAPGFIIAWSANMLHPYAYNDHRETRGVEDSPGSMMGLNFLQAEAGRLTCGSAGRRG